MMAFTNFYQFRIKESKFPNMLEEDRYWGSGMGVTPGCLDSGRADGPLRETELTRADVEIVPDQKLINKACRDYLTETDWYVTRYAETGVPIPDDVAALRTEARETIVNG